MVDSDTVQFIDEEGSMEIIEETDYSEEDEDIESGAKTVVDVLFEQAFEDFELI